MINHPKRSSVRRRVRTLVTGRTGELVKGPRRSSPGMVWVLWDDGEAGPEQFHRHWLERLDERAAPAQSDC